MKINEITRMRLDKLHKLQNQRNELLTELEEIKAIWRKEGEGDPNLAGIGMDTVACAALAKAKGEVVIDPKETLLDMAIVAQSYSDLIDELEDRVDVDDGPNGEPTPNYAMRLLQDQDKGGTGEPPDHQVQRPLPPLLWPSLRHFRRTPDHESRGIHRSPSDSVC